MTLTLINKDYLEKGLTDIRNKFQMDKSKVNETIAAIAELITGNRTNTNNETVRQTFEAIKDKDTGDKKKLLFSILRIAGNVGLTYFGIPVRF